MTRLRSLLAFLAIATFPLRCCVYLWLGALDSLLVIVGLRRVGWDRRTEWRRW